jgi:hypothetical protein
MNILMEVYRTHLPLANDPDLNKNLGEWLKDIKYAEKVFQDWLLKLLL